MTNPDEKLPKTKKVYVPPKPKKYQERERERERESKRRNSLIW
ncbi:hypothetical protein [endosymbiont GvMRE of Glomus versiforme]|nr:hypothetical protein [endosymbiont GvMRE of Glomus versiforme]